MPFAADTLDQVMGILRLPVVVPAWVERTQDALNRAENYGGEAAIARIEGYIADYNTAQQAKRDGADEAGLEQADVLRWGASARLSGFKEEMGECRQALLDTLFTEPEKRAISLLNRGNSNTVRILR